MRFRLPSFYFRRTLFPELLFLSAFSADATVTVNAVSPYTIDSNDRVYYAYDDGVAQLQVDTQAGFFSIDLDEDTSSDPSLEKLILFDVTASGISETGTLVFGLLARNTTDTTKAYLVPIAAAEVDTTGTPAQCGSGNCHALSGSNYLTADFEEGKTLRVGIYPNQICDYLQSIGFGNLDGSSCSGGGVSKPATDTVGSMALRFVVTNVSSSSDEIPDSNNGNTESSDRQETDIDLYFQNGRPTFNCSDMENFYFPGDEAIFIDTNKFAGASGIASGASASQLVLFFKRVEDNTVTGDYPTYNDYSFRSEAPLNAKNQTVSGFVNTTTGSDSIYRMSTTVRNTAGILAVISSPDPSLGSGTNIQTDTACSFAQIQTAEIQGLIKSSRCFIATASFESDHAPPVVLLRSFRDQILRSFSLGKMLIEVYEHWSPVAANWLLENPRFRSLILVLLIPVELFAALVLYLPYGLAVFVLSLGLLYSLKRRNRVV